jgi:YVTN family beta-propeller protein
VKGRACAGFGEFSEEHFFMQIVHRLYISAVLIVFGCAAAKAQLPLSSYPNFEGSQTNPVRLSPDGTRLFVVNTAAGTLSVFDLAEPSSPALIAQIPVGVEPVSVNPRTSDEAWVVNQVSDSISIVSVSRGIVTDTIYAKDEPMDVVFAGSNQAFVSLSRNNQIAVFDTTSHALRAMVPVFGGNPRALAVSRDGTKVYAAFALGGNGTTVIPSIFSPAQPPPTNPDLPPPPRTSLIVKAANPIWSFFIKFRMPDNDVAVINAGPSPAVSGYYSGVGTINLGLGVNPVTGDIFVANTEARNAIRFEPNVRAHFVDNRITRIRVASGQVTPFDLNPTVSYVNLPDPASRAVAIAQPTAVAFDPSGEFMYVASFGTDRIAVVDNNGSVLSRIEVAPASGAGPNVDPKNKRGPRGLALHAAARLLYVSNRISNTLIIIDTEQRTVVDEIPIGYDPTPLPIRNGRGFLYDAKLSGNGTGSCASCHIDGDMDHLGWDLGNPGGTMTTIIQGSRIHNMHPMKGPMTTQTLRGLLNTTPLHWRGDRLNFSEFNGAFDSLMGGTKLSAADILAYNAFINTLLYQPNPWQNLDRTLATSLFGGNAVAGRDTFINAELMSPGPPNGPATCNGCHMANPGPGTNRVIHPAIRGVRSLEQPLKVPQLRNIYQKLLFDRSGSFTIDGFGLSHEGALAGFDDFFAVESFAKYSETQKRDLSSFVMSFDTGTAPAVGYTKTLTAANLSAAAADWSLLENQAQNGNADLIGHGTIQGQRRGLYYDTARNFYRIDSITEAPVTRAQLESMIQAGDVVSIVGVYPGTGLSMFLSRSVNGIR